jgi:ABC-type iron transport system FetAB ATPase subunit
MDLWVSGFRGIRDARARFPLGVSGLTGDSGAGKTTLLTGLCWILYGSQGTGPHRALKIQSAHGAAAGAAVFHTPAGVYTVVRAAPGKRASQPPEWLHPAARAAVIAHASHSVFEALWIDGVPANLAAERARIFRGHATFTNTSIVPQKLPSPLLVAGKLSQTVQEYFFPDDGPDCPGFYTAPLAAMQKELRGKLAASTARRAAADQAKDRADAATDGAAVPLRQDTVRPRAVSAQIRSTAAALYVELGPGTKDSQDPPAMPGWRVVADFLREARDQQRLAREEWRIRTFAAEAAERRLRALPDPERHIQARAQIVAALRALLAPVVGDDVDVWTRDARARTAAGAEQRRLAKAVELRLAAAPGSSAIGSLSAARARLDESYQAEAQRSVYERRATLLGVTPEQVPAVLARAELDEVVDEEARTRAQIALGWHTEVAAAHADLVTAIQVRRERQISAQLQAKLANMAAAAARSQYDTRAAALGVSRDTLSKAIQLARADVLGADEEAARNALADSWRAGAADIFGALEVAYAAWRIQAQITARAVELRNAAAASARTSYEARAAKLGTWPGRIGVSLVLADEEADRAEVLEAWHAGAVEIWERITRAAATFADLARESQRRADGVRSARAAYAAEAGFLGTTPQCVLEELRVSERADLAVVEEDARRVLVSAWADEVRHVHANFLDAFQPCIESARMAARETDRRNMTAAAEYASRQIVYKASVVAADAALVRRAAAEAEIIRLEGELAAASAAEAAASGAVAANGGLGGRAIGIPARCPACETTVYISGEELLRDAVDPTEASRRQSALVAAKAELAVLRALTARLGPELAKARAVASVDFPSPLPLPIAPIPETVQAIPVIPRTLRLPPPSARVWGEAGRPEPDRTRRLRALAERADTWNLEDPDSSIPIASVQAGPRPADMTPSEARRRATALAEFFLEPYPDLEPVPVVPRALTKFALAMASRDVGQARPADPRSRLKALEELARADYPQDTTLPAIDSIPAGPAPFQVSTRPGPNKSLLTELRSLATEPYPAAQDLAGARAAVAYFEAVEALDEHIRAHGNLAADATFSEPDVSARLSELAGLDTQARAEAEELAAATEQHAALIALAGPAPRSDAALDRLPEMLADAFHFEEALRESMRAREEVAAAQAEGEELARRLAVTTEALEYVMRTRADYVGNALDQITENVNHVLARLFEGHARYVLRADGKDQIESVLDHGGRENIDLSALSGGELDRFSIAVATAFACFQGCPVLIFDETIASLDPARRADCVEAVAELLPGRAVVFITHDPPQGLFETVLTMASISAGPAAAPETPYDRACAGS